MKRFLGLLENSFSLGKKSKLYVLRLEELLSLRYLSAQVRLNFVIMVMNYKLGGHEGFNKWLKLKKAKKRRFRILAAQQELSLIHI